MSAGQLAQQAIQEVALRAILAVERVQTGATFYPAGKRFFNDPYRAYRRLREKDPVHRSRLINGWVLTRYADVSDRTASTGQLSPGGFHGLLC